MKKFMRIAATAALSITMGSAALAQHYTQTNLVSSTPGVAPVTDPQLVDPWGVSRGSGSPWWVSDQATGLSTLYNGPGAKQGLVVTIPVVDPNNKNVATGPTGTIFNGSSTDFLLAPKAPAAFLFVTLDGAIAGWNASVGIKPGASAPSTNAVLVATGAPGSTYTGLTSALIDGKRYLYAANFGKGRVDVYDNAFHPVKLHPESPLEGFFEGERFPFENRPFVDELLPRGFVPFNVQAIGNDIVVTYALHQEGSPVETDGPGLGYVDIFSSNGHLVERLQHGDWLNAPWGVALAPTDFGRFSHDLLVGQFAGGGTSESSGYIAAYNLTTGKLDGLLQDATGKPLAISGIWSISPGNVSPSNLDASKSPAAELYFTAATNGTGGLFGYLTAVPSELTVGNDQ